MMEGLYGRLVWWWVKVGMRWIWEIGGFISEMVGMRRDAVIKMGMDWPSNYNFFCIWTWRLEEEVAVVMPMRMTEEDWLNVVQKQEKGSFFRCALNRVGEHSGRMILGSTPFFSRATTMTTSTRGGALHITMLSERVVGKSQGKIRERWRNR